VLKVVYEKVEGRYSLPKASIDMFPVLLSQDPRDDVKREDLLGSSRIPVDVEGYPHVQQRQFGSLLFASNLLVVQSLKPANQNL